jgi:SAM-dependent methyltransferase
VAEVYDASRGLPAEANEALFARVTAATGLNPSSRLLDAGCGTGVLALPFVRGCRYTGVDASAAMLAQFRASAIRGSADLVHADLAYLPFPSGCFSVLLAIRVLGVVPGWRRAIAEFLRVLRPGGFLISGRVERQPESMHMFIRDQRNRLLGEIGADVRRPGADGDAVFGALVSAGVGQARLEPIVWLTAVVPQRVIDRTLSGWRLQALPQAMRDGLRERLTQLVRDRYGDLDRPWTEEAALVLQGFQLAR